AKNRMTQVITIPNQYMPILSWHIKSAVNSDYLFSDDGFKPGTKKLAPKKISDTWDKFRKEYKIQDVYQFYSLKDTGITDLLESGIPAIKVRDQARHRDIRDTEKYTRRTTQAESMIMNSGFSF